MEMRPLPPPQRVRTVAVRLTNWVGDVVMNTPFLARVRQTWPAARIVVFGRANVVGLLANHPHVDGTIAIQDRGLAGLRKAAAQVREARADVGFLLPNSLHSAMLFRLAGVPARVGYDRDARRALLTHPIALRPDDLAVHETRYYLRLLDALMPTVEPPPPLRLSVSEEEATAMRAWLDARGIANERFVLGVNPAAFYGTAKRWDAVRFAEAARTILEARDGVAVVTGLPSEREVAQSVCDAGGGRFINAAGEMKLRELMAFLARADLFLTNDSGAMHIAAALGTRLIAVFGSTDWVTTAPLSARARIVRVHTDCAPCLLRHCPIDHRCMVRVTPTMVVAAAESLLKESASPWTR